MADITYPLNLPQPLLNSYSNAEYRHTKNSPVQSGAPRFELSTEDKPMTASITFVLKPLDYALFDGWYKYDLAYGSKLFNLKLYVGKGYVNHECYFLDEPTFSSEDNLTRVTASILALEKKRETETNYDQLKAIYDGFKRIPQTVNAFNLFVENTLGDIS